MNNLYNDLNKLYIFKKFYIKDMNIHLKEKSYLIFNENLSYKLRENSKYKNYLVVFTESKILAKILSKYFFVLCNKRLNIKKYYFDSNLREVNKKNCEIYLYKE